MIFPDDDNDSTDSNGVIPQVATITTRITRSKSKRTGMEFLKDHFLRIYLGNNFGIFSVSRQPKGVNAANKRVRDGMENETANTHKKANRTGMRS